jgi:hypothetical protein
MSAAVYVGGVVTGVATGVGVTTGVVVFGAVVAVDCGAFCAAPLASAACVCCVVSFGAVVVVVAATRASVAALFCATIVGFSQYLYTSAICKNLLN